MARKSKAVEAAPPTVAERRRNIRAATSGQPGVAKVEIDLSKPTARKALTALHPRPENETMLDATPELEAAAYDYVTQRDAAKVAGEKKDAAGNILCNAIGKNLGIRGKGWKATWDMSNGNVDWAALVKAEGISDETVAKYRKPQSRGFDLKEVAEADE